MHRRFQVSFLPVFFTVLTVAFAIAVTLRIRSFSDRRQDSPVTQQETSAASTPTANRSGNRPDLSPLDDSTRAADATAAATATERPEARRAREERYRELLHAPIPAGRPAAGGAPAARPPGAAQSTAPNQAKPAAQSPSLLSRMVAPIVRAFGGGSSAPQPAPATTTSAPPSREAAKDPNSDTTPPQLLSVTFEPSTIHDGEETTIVINATDDLSGIRSIAGNVISPSGALQGFAVTREGDLTRYVARLLVPKNAAEGVWRINYLNLTDNANNSTTVSFSQGTMPATAVFRVVSSNADSTPPTLRAIWLDKPSVKGGEKNTVFVQADDDKSGVNLVSGVFLSPAKLARISFGCRAQDSGNTFTCDFTAPLRADCGEWQLEQVQLQDKANNMIAVRRDNPLVEAVHVSVISDQCDSHPPVVQSIALDRYSTPAPGTLTIRINVSDDISGVGSVSGHFVFTGAVAPNAQPPRIWFACSASDAQTWSGPVPIPDKSAIGVWRLEQLQVIDKASNLKIYSSADQMLSNITFRVQ